MNNMDNKKVSNRFHAQVWDETGEIRIRFEGLRKQTNLARSVLAWKIFEIGLTGLEKLALGKHEY